MRPLLGVVLLARSRERANASTLLVGRFLLFHPLLEIRLGHYGENAVHTIMSQAAELRAYNFIIAGIARGEVHVNFHAGHGVLLQSQLAHEETVRNVLRANNELDFASRRS